MKKASLTPKDKGHGTRRSTTSKGNGQTTLRPTAADKPAFTRQTSKSLSARKASSLSTRAVAALRSQSSPATNRSALKRPRPSSPRGGDSRDEKRLKVGSPKPRGRSINQKPQRTSSKSPVSAEKKRTFEMRKLATTDGFWAASNPVAEGENSQGQRRAATTKRSSRTSTPDVSPGSASRKKSVAVTTVSTAAAQQIKSVKAEKELTVGIPMAELRRLKTTDGFWSPSTIISDSRDASPSSNSSSLERSFRSRSQQKKNTGDGGTVFGQGNQNVTATESTRVVNQNVTAMESNKVKLRDSSKGDAQPPCATKNLATAEKGIERRSRRDSGRASFLSNSLKKKSLLQRSPTRFGKPKSSYKSGILPTRKLILTRRKTQENDKVKEILPLTSEDSQESIRTFRKRKDKQSEKGFVKDRINLRKRQPLPSNPILKAKLERLKNKTPQSRDKESSIKEEKEASINKKVKGPAIKDKEKVPSRKVGSAKSSPASSLERKQKKSEAGQSRPVSPPGTRQTRLKTLGEEMPKKLIGAEVKIKPSIEAVDKSENLSEGPAATPKSHNLSTSATFGDGAPILESRQTRLKTAGEECPKQANGVDADGNQSIEAIDKSDNQRESAASTPKSSSSSKLAISDLLGSGELKRLNTTPGFWAPTPDVSHVLSRFPRRFAGPNPRPKRQSAISKCQLSPKKQESSLLQLRKKKLIVLQKQRQIKQQTSKEEQQTAHHPTQQDTEETHKRDRFIFGKRRRRRRHFKNKDSSFTSTNMSEYISDDEGPVCENVSEDCDMPSDSEGTTRSSSKQVQAKLDPLQNSSLHSTPNVPSITDSVEPAQATSGKHSASVLSTAPDHMTQDQVKSKEIESEKSASISKYRGSPKKPEGSLSQLRKEKLSVLQKQQDTKQQISKEEQQIAHHPNQQDTGESPKAKSLVFGQKKRSYPKRNLKKEDTPFTSQESLEPVSEDECKGDKGSSNTGKTSEGYERTSDLESKTQLLPSQMKVNSDPLQNSLLHSTPRVSSTADHVESAQDISDKTLPTGLSTDQVTQDQVKQDKVELEKGLSSNASTMTSTLSCDEVKNTEGDLKVVIVSENPSLTDKVSCDKVNSVEPDSSNNSSFTDNVEFDEVKTAESKTESALSASKAADPVSCPEFMAMDSNKESSSNVSKVEDNVELGKDNFKEPTLSKVCTYADKVSDEEVTMIVDKGKDQSFKISPEYEKVDASSDGESEVPNVCPQVSPKDTRKELGSSKIEVDTSTPKAELESKKVPTLVNKMEDEQDTVTKSCTTGQELEKSDSIVGDTGDKKLPTPEIDCSKNGLDSNSLATASSLDTPLSDSIAKEENNSKAADPEMQKDAEPVAVDSVMEENAEGPVAQSESLDWDSKALPQNPPAEQVKSADKNENGEAGTVLEDKTLPILSNASSEKVETKAPVDECAEPVLSSENEDISTVKEDEKVSQKVDSLESTESPLEVALESSSGPYKAESRPDPEISMDSESISCQAELKDDNAPPTHDTCPVLDNAPLSAVQGEESSEKPAQQSDGSSPVLTVENMQSEIPVVVVDSSPERVSEDTVHNEGKTKVIEGESFSLGVPVMPETKRAPLRKVKRRRNAWQRGVVKRAAKMYRKSVQHSEVVSHSNAPNPVVVDDPLVRDGEIPSLQDQSLITNSQTLTNTVRDAKKTAKELRKSAMLRRLQTDANLAGGALDDSELQGRSRSLREVPKSKTIPALRKELSSDVNVIDSSAKFKSHVAKPTQAAKPKKPVGRPRKHRRVDRSELPKLILSTKPVDEKNIHRKWYKTPPRLSPQPIGPALASAPPIDLDLKNQDVGFVCESVDDTDLHLYLSGVSDEEPSPAKSFDGDLREVYRPRGFEEDLAVMDNIGRKESHKGIAVDQGSLQQVNSITPQKSGLAKMKGKRGRPPGTPMTEEEKMKVRASLLARYDDYANFKMPRTARKSAFTPSLYLSSAASSTTAKKFSLRQKTTRSPLEMLEMKRKQEEAIYDMEQERRLAKRINRLEKRFSQASADNSFEEELEDSDVEIKSCSVVLNDFVKKLHLESIDMPPAIDQGPSEEERRPQSPAYVASAVEEDWCADLEDFQDDANGEWTGDGQQQTRPFIPRLKLKRVPKTGKEKKAKGHKSKKRPKFVCPRQDAQQPLKLVIKTEVLSSGSAESPVRSSAIVDVSKVQRQGFEGSFVDFLQGKKTDEFMSCNQRGLGLFKPKHATDKGAGNVNKKQSPAASDDHLIMNLGNVAALKSKSPSVNKSPPVSSLISSNQRTALNEEIGAMQLSYTGLDTSENSGINSNTKDSAVTPLAGMSQSQDNGEKNLKNYDISGELVPAACVDRQKRNDVTAASVTGSQKKNDAAAAVGEIMERDDVSTAVGVTDSQKKNDVTPAAVSVTDSQKRNDVSAVAVSDCQKSYAGITSVVSVTDSQKNNFTTAAVCVTDSQKSSGVTMAAFADSQKGKEVTTSQIELNKESASSNVCSTTVLDKENETEKPAESQVKNNNNSIETLFPTVRQQQTKSSPPSKNAVSAKDGMGVSPKRPTTCSCPEGWKVKVIQLADKHPLGVKFSCKRCSFNTLSNLAIESHIYSHIPGIQFRCAYCESEFSSMAATASHMKNTHQLGEAKLHISRHVEEHNFYDSEDSPETVGMSEDQVQPTGERMVGSPRSGGTQVAGSVVVAGGDGSGQGGQSPPVVISVLVSSGAAAANAAGGGNHTAGVMVRPGNLAPSSGASSSSSNRRRYVCTHCGFSTNVRADAEHHVSDLHPTSSIYACSLCKENTYYTEAEIKQHSAEVHPSRDRPYRQLPDFYDAEKLSNKLTNCEDIVIEMAGSVFQDGHVAEDSSSVDHRQKAKDYLHLQEGLKEKRSAEADSTTAVDYMEDEAEHTESEPTDSQITSQVEVEDAEADSGHPEEEKTGHDGAEKIESKVSCPVKDVSHSCHSDISSSAVCSTEAEKDVTPSAVEEAESMDDVEIGGDVSLRATDGAAEDEDGGDTGSSLKIVEVVSLSNSEAPRDDELSPQDVDHEAGNKPESEITQDSTQKVVSSSETSSSSSSSSTAPAAPTVVSSVGATVSSVSDLSASSSTDITSATTTTSSFVLTSESQASAQAGLPSSADATLEPGEGLPAATTEPQESLPVTTPHSKENLLRTTPQQEEGLQATPSPAGESLPASKPQPKESLRATTPQAGGLSAAATAQPGGGLPLSYKCSACRVHTPYLLMMVKHLKAKHPHMGCFSCPYCKISAPTSDGSTSYQPESFVTQKQLRSHIRKYHPDKTGRNEIALSAKAKQFVEAMVLPAGPECIRVGNRLVLEEDIHTCTYCSVKMTSLASVYEHLNDAHADLFEFVCPICQSFKSKDLEAISSHSLSVHLSEVETDKVHVSVPKNLFSVLKCISKGGKYIEKQLDGTSTSASGAEANANSKEASSAPPASASKSAADPPPSGDAPTKSVTPAAPPTEENSSAPLDLTSASQTVNIAAPPAHSPATTPVTVITPPPAHMGVRSPVAVSGASPSKPAHVNISSSLFDTSSMSVPPHVAVSPIAGSSSAPVPGAAASSFLSPQQQKSPSSGKNQQSVSPYPPSTALNNKAGGRHAKTYTPIAPKSLPVLNVPTIVPRPLPSGSVGVRQRVPSVGEPLSTITQPAASPVTRGPVISHTSAITSPSTSQLPQPTHHNVTLLTTATSYDDLPDNEPNPDAFKIFNLQPTAPLVNSPAPLSSIQSASPSAVTALPSPNTVPTVFPPVSTPLNTGYIQGPIVGFPAGLVISQALLPPHASSYSFSQQQQALFRAAAPGGALLPNVPSSVDSSNKSNEASSSGTSGLHGKQRQFNTSSSTFTPQQRAKSTSAQSANTLMLKEQQKRELLLLKQRLKQQKQAQNEPDLHAQIKEKQKQFKMLQLQLLQQKRQQQQMAQRQQMFQRAMLNHQQQARLLAQQVAQTQNQSSPPFPVSPQAWLQQQQQQQRQKLQQQQQGLQRQKHTQQEISSPQNPSDYANAAHNASNRPCPTPSSSSSFTAGTSSSSSSAASSALSSPRPAKGVHKRSMAMYHCPYCPTPVVLKALDVASHIHQNHPGNPVVFKRVLP